MEALLLHQRKRSKASKSDEYETPREDLFEYLCDKYKFYPTLDVCATAQNTKCPVFFTKRYNALKHTWVNTDSFGVRRKVWCNPPHSMTEEFVEKAYRQFELGVETMMIIPANSMCTKYAKNYIRGSAFYEPIFFRPTFLVKGKKSKFNARNGYFVVIWRKK